MVREKKLKKLTLTQVKKLASDLAVKYQDQNVVIGLIGPLGAGKTTFVKNFARYLGITKIKSPSFVIANVHSLKNKTFYHFDFYRLETEKQLLALGFNEILNSDNNIVLIEWVDKFPKIRKACDLIINFQILEKNLRNVTIK